MRIRIIRKLKDGQYQEDNLDVQTLTEDLDNNFRIALRSFDPTIVPEFKVYEKLLLISPVTFLDTREANEN